MVLHRSRGARSCQQTTRGTARLLSVIPRVESLDERCLPYNVYWAVDADGLWNVAANWIDDQGSHRVPGSSDNVFLDRQAGPVTVTFDQTQSETVNSIHAATSNLVLGGGSFSIQANSEIDGSLTITGGATLFVNGPLMANGNTFWMSGVIDHGGPFINNGVMTLTGISPKDLRGNIDNLGLISNQGAGDLEIEAFAHLTNEVGATVELQTDAGIVGVGAFTGQFDNFGGLLKDGGTGVSQTPAVIEEGGIIDVETGTIALNGAGRNHTGGYFYVAGGAVLDLTGGHNNDNFGGYYTGAGDGTVEVASGALNIANAGAMFDFPAGLFQWTGGRIQTGGAGLTNVNAMTMSGPSQKDLRGTFINDGTFTQTDAGTFILPAFATFNNMADGSYLLASDANIFGEGSFNGAIHNAGLFLKSGATGTSLIVTDFTNQGGVLEVDSGTLAFARDVVQQSGSTILGGGNLIIQNLNIQGGLLTGSGTIIGNVQNAGEIDVGGAGIAGTIFIDGNYQQTAAGTLAIELGDNHFGEWDYLQVNGTATIAGTLMISLLDDYYANLGDSFTFLAANSRSGTFGTVSIPDIGSGLVLNIAYDATSASLVTNSQT